MLACISIFAGAAVPAWSWSRGGHMTVAYIAYQKLTPAAKERVDALLTKNPDYNSWVIAIPDTPANKDRRALTAFLRASFGRTTSRTPPATRMTGPSSMDG